MAGHTRIALYRHPGMWVVKLAVSGLLLWLVYTQLMATAWQVSSLRVTGLRLWGLVAALVLLSANMGAELAKYAYLLRKLGIPAPLGRLWSALLSGQTAALLTPNRLGEYPARLAFVAPADRPGAFMALVADRVAQMGVTLVMGGLALALLPGFPGRLLLLAGLGLGLLLLLLWARYPSVAHAALGRIPWLGPYVWGKLPPLPTLQPAWVPALVGLAGLRYLVFATQYVLLLWAFGLPLGTLWVWQGVALVYLLKSMVPGIALAELGVREAMALWVFGWLQAPPAPVFNATLVLFAVNLLLPALIGLYPSMHKLWRR